GSGASSTCAAGPGASITYVARAMEFAPARDIYQHPPRAVYAKIFCWADKARAALDAQAAKARIPPRVLRRGFRHLGQRAAPAPWQEVGQGMTDILDERSERAASVDDNERDNAWACDRCDLMRMRYLHQHAM
ncbi:unnamed protein product, partial [Prorocentrum cordatum]